MFTLYLLVMWYNATFEGKEKSFLCVAKDFTSIQELGEFRENKLKANPHMTFGSQTYKIEIVDNKPKFTEVEIIRDK